MKKILLLLVFYLLSSQSLYAIDFPAIEGWRPISDVKTYHPDDLFEYIDGAAELYLSYGFQSLLSRELSRDDLSIIVDIYDMGSALNAFGIYKSERPTDQELLAIGTEAVITPPYQCLLLKDNYYIKINLLEGDISEQSGKDILRAISTALRGKTGYPDALRLLPETDKIHDSDGFVRLGFLGLEELSNCVYAHYTKGEKEHRFFIMIADTNATKEIIWQNLLQKWEKTDHEQYPILYKEIPYTGYTGVMKTAQQLIGVSDCLDLNEMVTLLEGVIK